MLLFFSILSAAAIITPPTLYLWHGLYTDAIVVNAACAVMFLMMAVSSSTKVSTMYGDNECEETIKHAKRIHAVLSNALVSIVIVQVLMTVHFIYSLYS